MKIKGLRWMATFLAACMLMGAVPATAFAAKETTEAAETIPQVYRMDDDNDTVRLVIGKTPTLYIGIMVPEIILGGDPDLCLDPVFVLHVHECHRDGSVFSDI